MYKIIKSICFENKSIFNQTCEILLGFHITSDDDSVINLYELNEQFETKSLNFVYPEIIGIYKTQNDCIDKIYLNDKERNHFLYYEDKNNILSIYRYETDCIARYDISKCDKELSPKYNSTINIQTKLIIDCKNQNFDNFLKEMELIPFSYELLRECMYALGKNNSLNEEGEKIYKIIITHLKDSYYTMHNLIRDLIKSKKIKFAKKILKEY